MRALLVLEKYFQISVVQGLEVQVARLRISRDKLLAEVDSLSAELERLGLENTALIQAGPLAMQRSSNRMQNNVVCWSSSRASKMCLPLRRLTGVTLRLQGPRRLDLTPGTVNWLWCLQRALQEDPSKTCHHHIQKIFSSV